MDGVIHDWIRYFQDNWYKFNRLTILSFHDVKGDIILDTTTQGNSTVLLPVQNGNVALCRKGNIKFVCVQLRLDFSRLSKTNVTTHSCVLQEEYYIDLPQTTQVMMAGNNQAYSLTTWNGPADLKLMSCDTVKTTIIKFTLQDGPVVT